MTDANDVKIYLENKSNEAGKCTNLMETEFYPNEKIYRNLVEQIPVVTYTAATDEIGSTLFVSPQIEAMLQFPAKMWIDNPTMWSKQIHPDDEKRVLDAWNICYEEDRPFQCEYRMFSRDGTIRWFRDEAKLIRDQDGHPLLIQGVMLDITKQKNAEQKLISSSKQLKALSRRLVEVQETERHAVANELHDRVGQTLTALGFCVNHITSKLGVINATETNKLLNDCMILIEDTMSAVRDVMGELRPQMLDDYGLFAALNVYTQKYTERTGIVVTVTGHENLKLPKIVELALFRLVQEALNNVVKHSKASMVKITCQSNGGVKQFSIIDNGVGFNMENIEEFSKIGGWGLAIMRERAEAVGAQLYMDSKPGNGVCITVTYTE